MILHLEKWQIKEKDVSDFLPHISSNSFENEANDGAYTSPTKNINDSKNGTPSKKLYKFEHVNKMLTIILWAYDNL